MKPESLCSYDFPDMRIDGYSDSFKVYFQYAGITRQASGQF